MLTLNGATARALVLAAALLALPAPPAGRAVEPAAVPTVGPPEVHLLVPGTLSSTAIPLVVSWPAALAGSSPVSRYHLQRSSDGGPWTRVRLPSALGLSVVVKLPPWSVIRFRLRAIDAEGQRSVWAEAAPTWLSATGESDQTVSFSAGWQSVTDPYAYGGGRTTTTRADTSAALSFVGREVGWVAQRGRARGAAQVYVDGVWAATVDLYNATTSRRRLVFRASWPGVGAHTFEVRTVGTPGRPRVDVDAFVVLTDPVTQTLIGAGDIAGCGQTADSDTAAVVNTVDGIVFTAGDDAYDSGSTAEFANCYDPTWGAFKNRTRPTPGNHEYGTAGAQGYFDYFGAIAGQPGQGWYAYEAGTWRVYALNSNCDQIGGCGPDSAQYAWLAADLSAAPHRCVMAIWHHPLYSAGPHGNSTAMSAIFELLYQRGAEIVVNGHDHMYERFAPADAAGTADPLHGLREFVAGTGGAGLYAFTTSPALLEAGDDATHGVLRLDLASGTYTWQFLPVTGDTFTDSGSATCH